MISSSPQWDVMIRVCRFQFRVITVYTLDCEMLGVVHLFIAIRHWKFFFTFNCVKVDFAVFDYAFVFVDFNHFITSREGSDFRKSAAGKLLPGNVTFALSPPMDYSIFPKAPGVDGCWII